MTSESFWDDRFLCCKLTSSYAKKRIFDLVNLFFNPTPNWCRISTDTDKCQIIPKPIYVFDALRPAESVKRCFLDPKGKGKVRTPKILHFKILGFPAFVIQEN